jgi:hypothetical protein
MSASDAGQPLPAVDLLGGRGEHLGPPADDHDVRPVGGQPRGDRPADPGAAPAHHRLPRHTFDHASTLTRASGGAIDLGGLDFLRFSGPGRRRS